MTSLTVFASLAAEFAEFITGANLAVDGGRRHTEAKSGSGRVD